jgi:hypothetical protein
MTATIVKGQMYFNRENIIPREPENSDYSLGPHMWLCCSLAAIFA